ncbi:MAG: hypothetical protein ACR2MM_07185, partial [Flavobacteriaceae bacterium]
MKCTILAFGLPLLFVGCAKDLNDKDDWSKKVEANVNYETWSHYLGDPARTHFSSLKQVDSSNVHRLKLAWSYHSGGLSEERNTQIQTNPLVVGDLLYGVNAANSLFAINATNGKEMWTFVPATADETGLGLSRGLMY